MTNVIPEPMGQPLVFASSCVSPLCTMTRPLSEAQTRTEMLKVKVEFSFSNLSLLDSVISEIRF